MKARQAGIEWQIGRLGGLLALCFLGIALGLGYWGLIRAPALVARDDNPRRIEAERRVRRGNILDRSGRPLALSERGPLGVWERVYPAPEIAPVVGYYSIDHGTGGVEAAYDASIRGAQPSSAAARFQADLLHLHTAGVSVTLTIDLDLQLAASHALGDRAGAVVVLDVQHGDILALVSHPTFDPNTLEEDWPLLQFSPTNPMLNRAVQGLYPPGQVFQTVTLAAALEAGLAEPTTVFTDEIGVVLDVDPPISCAQDPPKTNFTMSDAYMWPCTVLFARLGLELGGEHLADYATRLGIGRPVDLPLEAAAGQFVERGMWSELLAARAAMGQGEVLVTPLEMALATATLANDGVRPVPRLVRLVGQTVVPATAEPRQVLRVEVAREVQAVMARAFTLGVPQADHNIAGRAGSANSGLPGAPPHAWFIGFAPADGPRYVIAVIVEHGRDGWAVAEPVAVQVLVQAMSGEYP